MKNFVILTVSTVCGYVGWFIASPLGFGWAFFISGVASIAGVFLGWKLAMRFFN